MSDLSKLRAEVEGRIKGLSIVLDHMAGKNLEIPSTPASVPWSFGSIHAVIEENQKWLARIDDTITESANEETLNVFLDRALKITDAYEKMLGRWSLNEQIAHVHSEVSEVYQARKHGEGRARELEENTDIILSALTLYHINGFTNEEIIESLNQTLVKGERRLKARMEETTH